jgi:hypothetical protein
LDGTERLQNGFEQLCCLLVISDVNAGAALVTCRLNPQEPKQLSGETKGLHGTINMLC